VAVAAFLALLAFVAADIALSYWLAKKLGLVRWLETQPPLGMGAGSALTPFGRRLLVIVLSVFLLSIPIQGCVILVAGILAAVRVI
jgi:hypothetical protein